MGGIAAGHEKPVEVGLNVIADGADKAANYQ